MNENCIHIKIMLNRIFLVISGFRMSIFLLVVYCLCLAAATWIEKIHGTSIAKEMIYHSFPFMSLHILIILNYVLFAVKYMYFRWGRIWMQLIHLSFVLILIGAAVTHYWGKDGIVHIREKESTCVMLVVDGNQRNEVKLPFVIQLDDFIVKRYPGSNSPSSYESFLTIKKDNDEYQAHVYMNNVLNIDGYRLYQSSFDNDEKGTVLSVNTDMIGYRITYLGYICLFIGLIISLLNRRSRFGRLYSELKKMQSHKIIMLFFCVCAFCTPIHASNDTPLELVEQYKINEEHAARFGHLAMQSTNGRIIPVNTFSSEVLRKLYKKNEIATLNSDQFLLSLLLWPDLWMDVPLISIDNEELVNTYGLSIPYTSYIQLFDSLGNYKIQSDLEHIYTKSPSSRNQKDKDLLKLDEQMNIFHLLINKCMLRMFPLPEDESSQWYAPGEDLSSFTGKDSLFVSRIFDWYLEELHDAVLQHKWETADEVLGMIDTYQQAKSTGVDISREKLGAEVKYNRLNIFRYCRIGYLLIGGLSLLWAIGSMFGFLTKSWIRWIWVVGILLVFHFHMYGMGIRWYIGGYAPWSNSYETMIYVAWATVLAGLLFARRNIMVFALAALLGGVILFVSGLNWMNPQITPLVPVLKSPWLMFHVAVIVAAYGFWGLSSLIGMTNLVLMAFISRNKERSTIYNRISELSIMNEMSLWIGLVMMVIGTFLGAVWANESWGRYWGWDPKETWALITIIVYSIVTHLHLLKYRLNIWLFNFLSVIAFSSVLMTFLGVNYFLSGMHSYGENQHVSNLFVWIAWAFVIILCIGIFAYRSMDIYYKFNFKENENI